MHILIVDDNSTNRQELRAKLVPNFEVCEACSGPEALNIARKNPPRVVVSDVGIPGALGISLLDDWKEDKVLSSIPFIVYSSLTLDFEMQRLLSSELGADAFIAKTDSIEKLASTIEPFLAELAPASRVPSKCPSLLRDFHTGLVRRLRERADELQLANNDLAARKVRLRAVIDNEPECVKSLGPNGELLEMNPAGLAMIEAASLDQVKGKCIYPFISEEYRPAFENHVARVFAGETVSLEFQVVGLRGGRRWLETHASPLRDSNGQVAELTAITRDITKRKQTEDALRESEASYRRIVETAEEGIWTIDSQGLTSFVNPKMAHMLGYTVEEMMGKSLYDFMDEEWREVSTSNVERRKQGITEQHDFKFRRKDGSALWALLSTNPIMDRNGAYSGALAMVTDITERKEIEDSLMQSEAMFRSLAESSQVGIGILQDLRFQYVNPALASMLGYTVSELKALPSVLDMVAEPDRMRAAQHAMERIAEIEPRATICFQAERKDGSICEVEVSGTRFIYQGRPAEISTVLDVTHRNEAERQLRLINETLEAKVQNRTQDLQVANRALASFGYSAAHDLRAPLRAISGYSHILKEDFIEHLPDDGRDLVDRILQNTCRMNQVIEGLLLLAGIGMGELIPTKIDLAEIAKNAFDSAHQSEPDRNAVFVVHEVPQVCADNRLMQTAIENLVNNALKFTRTRAAAEIEFGSKILEDMTVFYLRDNGIGFPPQLSEAVFKDFERLESQRDYPGTGLGLSIVRRVIERHGGRVWAEGTPDVGATFWFTLPG